MDLELSEEQLELRDHARSVLATECPPSLVRGVAEGTGSADGLWSTLVSLDWPAIAVDAEHGGLGQGFVAEAVLVEELGRVVAPGPYLATVTQFAPVLASAGAAGSETLNAVALGTCTGALALAEAGGGHLHDVATVARRTGDGWVLDGTKSHVLDGATAQELAVVARREGTSGGDGLGAFLVPGRLVTATPVTTLDPTLPLATVVLDQVELSDDRVLLGPTDADSAGQIEGVVQHATAAMALSTVATCRAIFETTVEYAKGRHQFGRPIGSFQAVKHRLADLYLAVERANSLGYYAAAAIAEDDPSRAVAASMAKAAAGDCQRLATRDGLQLHGGIGFTWENDLHFWLKRAITGAFLFGSAEHHRVELARLLGLAA